MTKIKTISILLLFVMLVIAVIPLNAYAINKDYAGHWAESTIQTWLDNNYVSGYPDGSFKPDEPITRAEFITIVNKLLGFSETANISFTDVTPNGWYYVEVQKAYKAGYISGVSESLFSPNSKLTREQAAVIISKILGLELNSENVQTFTDSNLISDWAKDYVNAAALAEIILGYSEDNTFRPQNPITRAEAVVLLERSNQFKIEDPIIPEGTIIPPPISEGGGGGGGTGPGPVDPIPSTIDLNVKNSIVMIGIDEKYNLADNLILNTSEVTLTYSANIANVIIKDAYSEGVVIGNDQGTVKVTVTANKTGYDEKKVDFDIIVAPVKISWTDPSGNKVQGEEQNINIGISLLEGASSVENVAVYMKWEKYADGERVAFDEKDISITNNPAKYMNNGIYQLIKGLTVNKNTEDIITVVKFNNVGEYKLTVYCVKE